MNPQIHNDTMEVDLLQLIRVLWNRAWMIVLSMILAGCLCFSYALFFVEPQYEASAMMYVNNTSFSVGDTSFSISSGELSAAKSLLDIYVIILESRATMEQVIDKADLEYTPDELNRIVSATSVNETEVFRITATCADPAEAEKIVDTIVDILPDRISDIVAGSSVRLVDQAVLPEKRSSPSYTKYAVIGMFAGAVLSCGVLILLELMDTTIRDEDYLRNAYGIPVLAVIPDAGDSGNKPYKKYYRAYSRSTGKEADKG